MWSIILYSHFTIDSDGVAAQKRSMFHIIQDWVDKIVTQDELDNAAIKYPHLTPKTKEAYYYRYKNGLKLVFSVFSLFFLIFFLSFVFLLNFFSRHFNAITPPTWFYIVEKF